MFSDGFFTALGTPTDEHGYLHKTSLARHVADQITFGASGLLLMGSMGLNVFIRQSEYAQAARVAIDAAKGAVPVFVGISDTCVGRCLDRVDALSGLPIDGVVATVPYYYAATDEEHVSFYTALAASSGKPVYLYDLPGVSKSKIGYQTVQTLSSNPNIRGIKTGDMELAANLTRDIEAGVLPTSFSVFYSGLDTFDAGILRGLRRQLDGMFCVTGAIAKRMYGEPNVAFTEGLLQILGLRDLFVKYGVFPAFSCAMNALGYPGRFMPDYMSPLIGVPCEEICKHMKSLGLL